MGGFLVFVSERNLIHPPRFLTSYNMPEKKTKTLARWVKGEKYRQRLLKAKLEYRSTTWQTHRHILCLCIYWASLLTVPHFSCSLGVLGCCGSGKCFAIEPRNKQVISPLCPMPNDQLDKHVCILTRFLYGGRANPFSGLARRISAFRSTLTRVETKWDRYTLTNFSIEYPRDWYCLFIIHPFNGDTRALVRESTRKWCLVRTQ